MADTAARRGGRLGEAMRGWLRAARVYLEPRVLVALCLGFASGLPLLLTLSTLTFWLAEAKIDKGSIGLFALVGLPYTWKFVWSPIIDRVPLPWFTARLGRRRGWLLLVQLLLAAAIVALGTCDPAQDLGRMALLALLVAFLSASQDIVIDAYRVELLEERQQGAGAAAVVIGYRVAMLLAGAGALVIAQFAGWFWAYAAMAGCLVVGMATVLLAPEPEAAGLAPAPGKPAAWLKAAVVEPFADFLRRNGLGTALLILAFIMLYKLGDALLGTMTNPFYVDLGFTKTEVATIVKGYGLVATLLGGFLGGIVVNRRGIVPALWICGLIQLGSNLVFVLQAWVGHELGMLALTISVENLAGGMGTAAFVAYLSSLCNLSYTATQYALLSSFMAQARTTLSAGGGFLAESMSWVHFFLLTTAAAIPGLLLLLWLQRRLHGMGPHRQPELPAGTRAEHA